MKLIRQNIASSRKSILIALFFCLFNFSLPIYSFSQDYWEEHLSTSTGLSTNTIYSIFEDKEGFIWLTTDIGVIRFDGKEYTYYDHRNGLPQTDIFKMVEGNSNQYYFLTNNGKLSYIDGELFRNVKELSFSKGIVSGYIQEDNLQIVSSFGEGIYIKKDNKIHSIYNEKSKLENFVSAIWKNQNSVFYCTRDGLYAINLNTFEKRKCSPFNTNIFYCRSYSIDDANTLLSLNDELYIFNSLQSKLTKIEQADFLKGNTINSVYFKENYYFIGTDEGFFKCLVQDNRVIQYTHSLKEWRISNTLIDREGNLWVSTLENGVYRFSDLDIHLIEDKQVFSIENLKGNLFLGLGKRSVKRCDTNGTYEEFRLDSNLIKSTNYVRGINRIDDHYFLSLNGSVIVSDLNFRNQVKLSLGIASIIEVDDNIIIGNQTGLYLISKRDFFLKYREPNFDFREISQHVDFEFKVRSIIKIDNHIYILTNNGVWEYDKLSNQVSNKGFEFTLGKVITDLELIENNFYVATYGEGLIYKRNNKIFVLNKENVLQTDYINCIQYINNHGPKIIIGSNNGLYIFDLNDGQLSNPFLITENDGLPSVDVMDLASFEKKLFLATPQGAFTFDLQRAITVSSNPSIMIKKILVNKNEFTKNLLEFSYTQNNIDILLQATAFRYRKVLKYFYSINDGEWRETKTPQIFMPSLNPGFYNLKIKSCIYDNCSEEVQLNFTIHPPFWRTTWFRVLAFIVFCFIIWLFFKIRVLTYNRDVVREILQYFLNKLKREEYISLKDVKDGSYVRVVSSEILFLKTSNNYVEFNLVNGKIIVVRDTLKSLLSDKLNGLKKAKFVQCHRMYAFNEVHFNAIHPDFIKVKEEKIPIGRVYSAEIKEKFSDLMN